MPIRLCGSFSVKSRMKQRKVINPGMTASYPYLAGRAPLKDNNTSIANENAAYILAESIIRYLA